MPRVNELLEAGRPLVVGCVGDPVSLRNLTPSEARSACDLVEIRLDSLNAAGNSMPLPASWSHLKDITLLFTARRKDEGGSADYSADHRRKLLTRSLDDAALIDIEVAGIDEMSDIIGEAGRRKIPWIASFHDFGKLPADSVLSKAAEKAAKAGAAVFKAAAMLSDEQDLERLVRFQTGSHGIPVATMGMGPLANRSRVRCALGGSLLNYGFLGSTPTAPGQWSAEKLKQAIADPSLAGL